jgi:hypothetical protein
MKPLYIFDIDGTLANCEHRVHILNRPGHLDQKWRDFYAACDKDAPIVQTLKTLELILRSGAEVWFWTGRSNEVCQKTINWLTDNTEYFFLRYELEFENILTMRDEGDHTPDHALKKQWLDGMLNQDRKRLVAVFEDRANVVKMWRDAGVTCYQVAPGNF